MVGVGEVRSRKAPRGCHAESGAAPARASQHVPPRGEEGFTLIELIIVLVLLPLVTGAIAMVLITTLKNQQGIEGRVTNSAAAATSSTFYVRDVQSAGSVTTAPTPASAPGNCPVAGASGTAKLLMGLQLQGTTTVVAYYMVTPAHGAPLLVRDACTDKSGTLTALSHQILSDNLSTSDPPSPVVTCLSPPPANVPAGVPACSAAAVASDWTPTYLVSALTLNVTQGCATAASCASYQYALTGDPQSDVPVPNITVPTGVLTLLGSGTDVSFSAFSNGNSVCAAGTILLDSGYDSTGVDPAIDGDRATVSNSVTAGTTSSCGAPQQDGIQIYHCLDDNSSGQACPTSGTHTSVAGDVHVAPGPVSVFPLVADPLKAWAAQHPVTPVTSPVVSCPRGSTMSCPAGYYPNGLDIPDNSTVHFAPGDYRFGPNSDPNCRGASLCVGSGDTVDFGSGHYAFTDGVEVGGSGSALCGGGPVTRQCPDPPPGGVFFYVSHGPTDLGNNGAANTVQLAPIPITSADPYHGVVLWQDGKDNSPVVLAGAASITGTIYVPNATVSLKGFGSGTTDMTTGDIVADSLLFAHSSSARLTVK